MKVLLVGYGYVGQALAKRLHEAGHLVAALRRSIQASAGPVQLYQGDAGEPTTLHKLPSDFDQIVCSTSPDARTPEAYERAYPKVVEALLHRFPTARLLLVSSTSVYDQQEGSELTESARATAASPTAAQIHRAELKLLAPTLKTHHVVIRASGIYGPGRSRLISSLLHHALDEATAQIWTSRIHRDDLAGIVHFLIERPQLAGVFHASDPSPTQLKDLSTWVRAHVAPTALPVVSAAVRGRKNRRIVPARLVELGYPFLYPSFRQGYEAVLAELAPSTEP